MAVLTDYLYQYLDVYMTKAEPAANSPAAGSGQTWFKVFDMPPTVQNGQLVWPSESQSLTISHLFGINVRFQFQIFNLSPSLSRSLSPVVNT